MPGWVSNKNDDERKRIQYESSKRYDKKCKYVIQSIEHPSGKTMNEWEMVQFAREQLKINHKVHGVDKDINQSDFNDPTNAWIYLLNIGLGRTSECPNPNHTFSMKETVAAVEGSRNWCIANRDKIIKHIDEEIKELQSGCEQETCPLSNIEEGRYKELQKLKAFIEGLEW